MSEFKMPAVGTAEYDALMTRWASKPVTFGQCNRLKSLFKQVADQGGYAGKVPAKTAKAWDVLTTRDEDRRWTELRSDKLAGKMTMKDAHELGVKLESLLTSDDAPVTVTQTKPAKKPAKAAEKPADQAVSVKSGDVILLDGEAVVIFRSGKRIYGKRA
ncbi:hypothetical protein HWB99_gp049 [Mycobacterium phage DrLupo]|uniref:Uncharacterized protein n=1 Tax=Mycobacterium phage DrLupo TaxID=2499037 RepID=A0A3S9UQM3_9CAUD|nr:hypothetical protein HWB99_gp049 [Mycobacterium phage DrLupo]AZS12585.1 hypothetical protein SEA_DRLUPO_49 [Mycobacterium phage DrLupo]